MERGGQELGVIFRATALPSPETPKVSTSSQHGAVLTFGHKEFNQPGEGHFPVQTTARHPNNVGKCRLLHIFARIDCFHSDICLLTECMGWRGEGIGNLFARLHFHSC